MWLLKLHFSISVLCLITFIGFAKVFKENIKENGWKGEGNWKKNKVFICWIFFIPVMNIVAVLLTFMMIVTKKSEFDRMVEENKKKKNERDD